MIQKIPPKELEKIYNLLPAELKEFIFSEAVADNISLACSLAEIPEEEIPKVAQLVNNVLIGILAPEEFEEALKSELGLNEKVSKILNHQIQRTVFGLVKEYLASIKEIEKPTPRVGLSKEELFAKEGAPQIPTEEEPKTKQTDKYREPID
jgi:hypothetical protein